MADGEALALALSPQVTAQLLRILARPDPADVHILAGPVRVGGRRQVVVKVMRQECAEGEGIAPGRRA